MQMFGIWMPMQMALVVEAAVVNQWTDMYYRAETVMIATQRLHPMQSRCVII